MSKKQLKKLVDGEETEYERSEIYERMINQSRYVRGMIRYSTEQKYFNLWAGSRVWTGMGKEAREWLMRMLWYNGSVAAFVRRNIGGIGFADYGVTTFRMYYAPATCILINPLGVSYIPNETLTIASDDYKDELVSFPKDKLVVLGYALHTHRGLKAILEPHFDRVVEIFMTARTNLYGQKIPRGVGISPDSELRAKDFYAHIANDDPYLFTDTATGMTAFPPIGEATPYILDKLRMELAAEENVILTILGIDNIGSVEKKERVNKDEANSNNDLINDSADTIDQGLKEFCSEIKTFLGITITFKNVSSPMSAMNEETAEKGDKDNVGNGKPEREDNA